jgi:hypothetical protein
MIFPKSHQISCPSVGSAQDEGLGCLHVALGDFQAKNQELRQLGELSAPALAHVEGADLPGLGGWWKTGEKTGPVDFGR